MFVIRILFAGYAREWRCSHIVFKIQDHYLPLRLRDKEIDINKKYEELRGSVKSILNLVVVGHVDAGKSTLMGHLLYLKGIVAQRTMHKYEQESKKLGKQSFMSRGVTVDVAHRTFETSSKTISLLDAPGHRDFIPSMITGAARADVAILVVDASTGGFEAGFETGGQTREHAILTRSLGLSELAVAVNKLDSVDWSQERFKEIVTSLKHFLKTVGYRDSDVTYIPCSGLTGENLVEPPRDTALKNWYSGPTLLEAIDNLPVPERAINRPIRFCISDVYKGQGSSMCVGGRLETGYIQNGDRLMLMPQGDIATVKGIQAENLEPGYSFAGDHVTLNISGIDPTVLHVGDFLCDPQEPIPQTTRIQARIVVFNITVPIIKGSQFDFHYQSVNGMARVKKLVSQLHKSTGQIIKNRPRALVKNSSAVIELEFERPLCLEVYKNYKELGRFMLRNNGVTVAAGMVTQIN
ncbi:HBS1-like protein [Armadillidium nasatum]|uniref:HBS1-like protein n=1 Tax=Armadillidium nasatum TaxID=96803 RepID=A0A5N5SZ00_9CRUS|nr:HBS1-like protein [Armadillidium nasatum]